MKNKAIYLDLQGTLGGVGTGDIRDFEFYPFSIEAIKKINESDFLAILITNQSNIGRGFFSMGEYQKLLEKHSAFLKDRGCHFDLSFCCPHIRSDNCNCKKPKPGMIYQSLEKFNIDLTSSWIIGDMGMSDMVLGDSLGMNKALVKTGCGKGSLAEYRSTWKGIEPELVADNILTAIESILD